MTGVVKSAGKYALLAGTALALSMSAASAASMTKAGMDKRVADLEREVTLLKNQMKQTMMADKGPDRGVVSSTAAKVRFYGQVNRAIRFASTPSRSDFQSVDNSEANSRFGLVADVQVNKNLSARAQLETHWAVNGRAADFDETGGSQWDVRLSTISLTHKDMGTLSIGHGGVAGGGSYFSSFAGTGLAFGVGGAGNDGLTATDGEMTGVARVGAPGGLFAPRQSRVLYQTPSLMGVSLQGSYNQGRSWSVGGNLSGLPGVKAVGVLLGVGLRNHGAGGTSTLGISGGIQHNASGLSVNGWYSQERNRNGVNPSAWMADLSWTGKVIDAGPTSFTVSYGQWKDGGLGATTRYFAAVNQGIATAATDFYAGVSYDTGTYAIPGMPAMPAMPGTDLVDAMDRGAASVMGPGSVSFAGGVTHDDLHEKYQTGDEIAHEDLASPVAGTVYTFMAGTPATEEVAATTGTSAVAATPDTEAERDGVFILIAGVRIRF